MRLASIQRVFGLLLLLFSLTHLPPLAVSLLTADGAHQAFVQAFTFTVLLGIVIWLPVRRRVEDFGVREGFLVVALFWTVFSLLGAVPLALTELPSMSVTDAVFESVSGLTTTGATVLTGLDELPRSVLYYRHQLQWLGGMGIIVLAVAILPLLGIGGTNLYRAEIAGPVKNNRVTARIAETAQALWAIYVGLTSLCAVAYFGAGMSLFDAVCHAFSTVSIGGFSTHDASMAYFSSPLIEGIAIVFMIVAGVNFALHFTAWRALSVRPYFEDAEVRAYVGILLSVGVVCIAYLLASGIMTDGERALRAGLFQAVSIGTTTGFTTAPYHLWPGALPILLLLTSFIGACAASTGGGMKVIRVLLLYKQGLREVMRVVHPNAMIAVRIGKEVLSGRMIESIWGFFAVYLVAFTVLYLLMATQTDLVTAFSSVAACMNNMGPGLGEVGTTYAVVSDFGKWVLCLAMVLGRLEVFTLLALFTPTFWRN